MLGNQAWPQTVLIGDHTKPPPASPSHRPPPHLPLEEFNRSCTGITASTAALLRPIHN